MEDNSTYSSLPMCSTNPYTGNNFSDAYKSLYIERNRLPISKRKVEFLQALDKHKCILLEAETGSGKTTQVPQWCVEWWKRRKPHEKTMVCCTQPRRLATVSVAQRVANEMDVQLGDVVGYSIRFEELISDFTLLKYCTDGVLLAESSRDELLTRYGVILLDEVHERTMITDVVMGIVKRIMQLRPELRVVVMSASLSTGSFEQYFSEYEHYSMQIRGRCFPVMIHYSDCDSTMAPDEYIHKAVAKAIEIHKGTEPGDILMFLCGQEEIEKACEMLELEAAAIYAQKGELIVLPLYGSMYLDHQWRQLMDDTTHNGKLKHGCRRCIVATNVAETSMTIEGIVFVIDPGFCKRNIYNPRSKVESLLVQRISRASAIQRAGRAGRTRPGKCYRLYTEHCLEKIMKEIVPEIGHSNLGSVVLRLKKSGINDIYTFDLIDAPPKEQIQHALKMLTDIGAIDVIGRVTPLGDQINSLPVDPPLARMLIESRKLRCSEEVISICAMISAPNRCFNRPRKKQSEADEAKSKFVDDAGDHLTLLRVYNAFVEIDEETKGAREQWCHKNYLRFRTLHFANDIRNQLANIMRGRLNIMLESLAPTSPLYPHNILKALLAGSFMKMAYFRNTASGLFRNAQKGYYVTVESQINPIQKTAEEKYLLHATSVLFKGHKMYSQRPEWVLFNEAVQRDNSDRLYLQTVSKIRPEWLADLAPEYRRQISLKPELNKIFTESVAQMPRLEDEIHLLDQVINFDSLSFYD